MGLSNAVSGGIMLAAMTAVMTGITYLFDTGSLASEATQERAALDDSIAKTSITMTDIQEISNTEIQFTVVNDGNTKLWDYAKFTLVVRYDPNPTNGVNDHVTEVWAFDGITTNNPAQGKWVIDSFSANDVNNDPLILNPGETIIIRGRGLLNFETGGTNNEVTATMSTDNGVVTSRSEAI